MKPTLIEILKPIVKETINQTLAESLRPIIDDLNSIQTQAAQLEKSLKELQQEVDKAAMHANENEQYSRRMCLRLFGLPDAQDISHSYLVSLLNNSLSTHLSEDNIDRVHRTGRTNIETPCPKATATPPPSAC